MRTALIQALGVLIISIITSCGQDGKAVAEEDAQLPLTPPRKPSDLSFLEYCEEKLDDSTLDQTLILLYGSKERSACPQLEQDLGGIESLNFRHLGISSLHILAFMPNLIWLDLGENPVHDLSPLAELTQINKLWLDSTAITSISPLAKLKAIDWLDLSATKVQSIDPLREHSALLQLNLSDTKLKDFNIVSHFSNLRVLIARAANLSDLDALSNLTRMSQLDVSGNQIKDLTPLSFLYDLVDLVVSGNPISSSKSEETCPTKGEISSALRLTCQS